MDSHVIAPDLACDQAEYSGDDHNTPKSCSDQKQQIKCLCFACAQPRWESEWNFSIEDMVPFNDIKNKSSSVITGDLMTENDKGGKSQKTWKNMGRVIYHRPKDVEEHGKGNLSQATSCASFRLKESSAAQTFHPAF